MRRAIQTLLLSCLIAWSALGTGAARADYNAGLDAYMREDYRQALIEFHPLAEQGDVDAQYMLGHMYATGKGVLQDYVESHFWFNLSAAGGKVGGAAARDNVARVMTPSQIAEAQRRAREWQPRQAQAQPAPSPEAAGPGVIRDIQQGLADLGFEPGPADGRMGARTQAAIRGYQRQQGLAVNGEASRALRDHIRATLAQRGPAAPAKTATAAPTAAPSGEVQELVDRLKELVERGTRRREADRAFLSDLSDLIRRYDWPWRETLLRDDFSDGDFTRNPAWTKLSGDFWVERGQGLRSWVAPTAAPAKNGEKRDSAAELFGTILGEVLRPKNGQREGGAQPSEGEIYSLLRVSDAFALELELRSLSARDNRRFAATLFKGTDRRQGYRLDYVAGERPALVLSRIAAGGTGVIGRSGELSPLEDGKSHAIAWRRDAGGEMVVALDGAEVLRAVDRSLSGPFDGLSLINGGGEFAVPLVALHGAGR